MRKHRNRRSNLQIMGDFFSTGECFATRFARARNDMAWNLAGARMGLISINISKIHLPDLE